MDRAAATDVGGSTAVEDLRARLPQLMLRDERRLRGRLDRLHDAGRAGAALARLADDVAQAEARVARRAAAVPLLTYPEELPVTQRREDLLAALASSQVVVVAGETGSGKTTQLPKLLLELGRGVRGAVAHTQPRRLAARTVAERVAEELSVPLGSVVGYRVRFTDRVGEDTLLKLMTDGVLLAELQRDRDLLAYDAVVLDEAHERSLNIDFLLGYLASLLPRRPDLKVVITSATIETERFSRHFGGAPVVEVTGRTYPVELRYRPLVREADDADDDAEPRDQVTAVCEAVAELQREGPGDVLVFLSGEREIRDTADALRRCVRDGTEVLPLYGRLSAAEQHRVFTPSAGNRVVLATNVAETSLTVPGIRYVVDPGTARISRYSVRTKVQRLPIEAISRASADQRAGRCGRVAAGICIRLYAEEDYLARPAFPDPEILRTNLASVLLQMAALGLGDVEDFPFLDPPDRRQVRDGVDLLHELGALDLRRPGREHRLTPLGRRLARLPVDPRLGRMVLEADRTGCVHEVLVLAAALSIQDPRERPADRQQAADAAHARFRDEHSDFTAWLNLWRYLQERQDELSSSAFRRLCRKEFLHYLRVREWQDLYGQLRSAVRDLELRVDESAAAEPVSVHRALLAGLLSHIGVRDADTRDYLGARGARFAVFPGSALARRSPRWVMAAELVETSRLFARTVARIDPQWVEPLAQHVVKRQYSEPRWDRTRAGVVAVERVSLYGVPIVAGRTVDYGRIDPALSRELFLRSALVEGDWDTEHRFFAANRELLSQVEGLEDRLRRRDLVVDDESLFAFYDARVPADVVSGRHFDAWWKRARSETPDLLTLTVADLVRDDAAGISALDFPDVWVEGDLRLDLHYVFDPGSPEDGVTVDVPVALLNRLDAEHFAWQVPGLRHDVVTELLRGLPKPVRRRLGPAPDRARDLLASLTDRDGPLLDALGRALRSSTGVVVDRADWDVARLPPHLRVTFRVHDTHGRVLAEGKDLDALRRQLAPRVRAALSSAAAGLERTGLPDWTLGTLPRTVQVGAVLAFPALVDERTTVGVRVLGTAAEQQAAHRLGVRRLLLLQLPSPLKAVVGRMPNRTKLALAHNPYGGVPSLLEDCVAAALDTLVAEAGGPAWDAEHWARLREAVRPRLERTVEATVETVAAVLAEAQALEHRLASLSHPAVQDAVTDMRSQRDTLVGTGFVARTGTGRLGDVLRYLQAAQRRLDRLTEDVERDRRAMRVVHDVERDHRTAVDHLPAARRSDPDVVHVRWMIEELRVSLFAQPMRTAFPVSEKRVLRALDALSG